MALVWLVECKLCAQRFAVLPRQPSSGKSTDALPTDAEVGGFECPHCHEANNYTASELIPGEGRIVALRSREE